MPKLNDLRQLPLLAIFCSVLLIGCAEQKFENVDAASKEFLQDEGNSEILSNFYKVSDSQTSFAQENLEENRTTLSFQARLADGTFVNNLSEQDITVKENNINVPNFVLSSNSQNIVQTVDIVFAVDVTGSMTPTIESAKTRLINFVNKTRAVGFHTRMCLVTFGDYTVQKCNKFYDNNPEDPATLSQVTELISEITKLRALKDKEDPGGDDLNENPMRAIIDTASAPWAENSQRFMIMITDDGFLYSPGNSGSVGSVAPKWPEVLSAIQSSQMRIFAATPNLAGYNKKFQNQSGIVEASGGEFFLFNDLIKGKITLDTILNRIISRVKTTYLVEYTADQVSGLDPSLPLESRKIKITLRSGMSATLVSETAQSNLPKGRGTYKKSWKISDKSINPNSLVVKVNGVEQRSGFRLEAGLVIFDQAPPKGSTIEISFRHTKIIDSLQFSPTILSSNEDIKMLSVFFNGIKAKSSDVIFEKSIEGLWTLRPSAQVFSENDPFQIRKNNGLRINVNRTGKKN